MPVHLIFYLVFSSQILLLSFYLPRQLLRRVRFVVDTYPPSSYPRLYPVPLDSVVRAQRNYRNMNLFALMAGFVLLLIGIASPSEEMLNWDSISVLAIYTAIQYSPMMIAATAGFTYFNLKRRADSRTTRTAELHRRRLFDFVSPTIVVGSIALYFAFILFIIYIRQFDFPWFGGYWNVFFMTAGNLLLAGMVVKLLHGKNKDPYQAYDDRLRQIRFGVNTMFVTSIAGTVFIIWTVTLNALDLGALIPVSLSLYLQLLALIGFRALRIDDVNFEVYKEDPSVRSSVAAL